MSESNRDRTSADVTFMRRALELAARGWGQVAPNPMVGAVIVRDGAVVGEGWHTRYGALHAEREALAVAGDAARGATMYVSLEPCNHTGKTPPCSEAIYAAGICRIVAAVADPNPVAQGGLDWLSARGVDVLVGIESERAMELNAPFFHALRCDRPFVQLKLAMSLDGALADHTRKQAWLTGAAARAEVHRLRASVDGVAVGIGTALADDPMLNVRGIDPAPRIQPARIVFDTSARLPVTSKLVRTAREYRTLVVCRAPEPARAAALEAAGVTLIRAASLADALRDLRTAEIRSVLVEGGSGIASAFVRDALADRLIIFRAPVILGSGALHAFGGAPAGTPDAAPRWRIVDSRRFGDDQMTVYARVEGELLSS
ncbi:MAG: riboflavin biosynthesis protein RibD [Gemmatimonadetes bacterium]|nr:riboflavin biosynthesis protein RibD [Gemmatimonadota bacterium]